MQTRNVEIIKFKFVYLFICVSQQQKNQSQASNGTEANYD